MNEMENVSSASRPLLGATAMPCNNNRNGIDGGVGARVMRNSTDWKWGKQVSKLSD